MIYAARKQFIGFHERTRRFSCIVAHRRAGKTVACVADLILAALQTKKTNARYAYIAPLYVQAKDVAWQYVKDFAGQVPGATLNEAELRCDFPNGSRVRLYGADNYDRLRGNYFDGVVLDEYGDWPPSAWSAVLRPALADRLGWAVFIGTPKGKNGFWEIWNDAQTDPDWFALSLRASETGILPQVELDASRKAMTPELYDQEYECSFDAAIQGAYYGKELAELDRRGRIGDVPHDPALPVYTAWDLGIGDSTAIWFWQVNGDQVQVIDHYEAHGHGLPHYAALLASKPYKYAKHFLPHDAKAKDLGTGRTRWEAFKDLTNQTPHILRRPANIMDGINALRLTLPHCWFDEVRCRDGLEALRQYRSEYDEKLRTFKDNPRHDWTSHSADAARYMAMAWKEIVPEKKPIADPFLFEADKSGTIRANLTIRELIERQGRKRRSDDE